MSQPFDGLTVAGASDIVEFLYSSTISPTMTDQERRVNGPMASELFKQRFEAMAIGAKRWSMGLSGLVVCLFVVHGALAQESATHYIDYPLTQGKVQPLQWSGVPKWATLDMQLRGRSESQTSINYTSGNEQLYELTRVYGGLEVRPTRYLTGYIQFIDTHALGLPLKYVASNMRDVFDDRQAYLEFHAKQVKVFAGRQELKYSSERLVGISD